MSTTSSSFVLSRRRLLAGAAGGAVTAGLSGCAVDLSTGQVGPTAPPFVFPDYPTKVEPRGTVRWLDSGDLKSVYETAVLSAFSAKHTAIGNDYQGTGWETIRQIVSLGIRNGSAPDVFQLPLDIPPQTAIAEGWVRPMDDLIADLDSWRSNWPETALIPGVHVFDDKLYSFPLNSSRRLDKMLFVDVANLRRAGYDDPAKEIRSWDGIATALRRSVDQGASGLMLGRDGLAPTVAGLATSNGWRGSLGGWAGMDMATGRFGYDADEVLEAFEFVQRLVRDKLVVPGYLTLVDKDARSQFSAGRSTMMFAGPYSLPAWKASAPQWKYDVSLLPARDDGSYVVPFAETGANNTWVYADTELSGAVGQILTFMGSPEGQKWVGVLSQGNLASLQPAANAAARATATLDERAVFCTDLAKKIMHTVPQVELRNADVARVRLALKPVTPIWADLMQGLFTGDLTDARAEFRRYNSALDAALDAAIAAAATQGSTVTRDDFAFANWDPNRDYTAADYQEL